MGNSEEVRVAGVRSAKRRDEFREGTVEMRSEAELVGP